MKPSNDQLSRQEIVLLSLSLLALGLSLFYFAKSLFSVF